jgi:hypothetical protein
MTMPQKRTVFPLLNCKGMKTRADLLIASLQGLSRKKPPQNEG